MKIATYNVNGINGRLPVLRWLEETRPDVACLQELKAPDEKFPFLSQQGLSIEDPANIVN
jgi:exodeoxyribonuclease-3